MPLPPALSVIVPVTLTATALPLFCGIAVLFAVAVIEGGTLSGGGGGVKDTFQRLIPTYASLPEIVNPDSGTFPNAAETSIPPPRVVATATSNGLTPSEWPSAANP